MHPYPVTEDDRICAWYEAQSEETLSYLFERFGASTPRQCWLSFHRDCSLPSVDSAASLPAPAAGEVGGNVSRNRAAWMSIADFLTLDNLRSVLAARAKQQAAPWAMSGKRSAAMAQGAACVPALGRLALPDGNHGETF